MKHLRFAYLVVLLSIATLVFAAGGAQSPAQSESQKAFDQLKTLAGTWKGPVTTVPVMQENDDSPLLVTLRVTSRGNAIVHEMRDPAKPDDPTKEDHPVTMVYLDNGQLTLIHYCDAGNRPRMIGTSSPDGKKVEFSFQDLSGSDVYGHMAHAIFTIIDANHHSEDWTYIMPGNKPMHAHFDLTRVQ